MYTYIANISKPDQVSIISQDEIIRKITGDTELKAAVSEIRRLNKRYEQTNDLADRNEKESLKTKLPAFVPAGEFSYRSTRSLTKYWGRIVVDIDKIKDPERLRATIKINHESSVVMAFLSPTGTGLKVIHQLEYPDLKSIDEIIDFHKQAFVSLINLYKCKYKITEIDLAGSDLCRLCYYSFDDKAFYNPEAKGWQFTFVKKNEPSGPILNSKIEGFYSRFKNDDEKTNYKIVQDIIQWCLKENVSLLDHYNDWIKVMFALKNTFSNQDAGLELFSQLSSTSYKYKPEECAKKWRENLIHNSANKATVGSLIYMAKQYGWRPLRKLPIGPFASYNTHLTTLEESNIRIKQNELTHQLYYSESPDEDVWFIADDYIAGKINLAVLGGTIKREDFYHFLNYIPPKFSPVKEFLDSLPTWDGKDRIKEIAGTLSLKNENDADMVETLLRRWFIGVINGLHNNPKFSNKPTISANENLLILIGGQGVGKTLWMRTLIPRKWYSSLFVEKHNFNFANKDDELLTCTKAIIAMDELAPILNDKTSNEQLKAFLSQKTFNTRVAYGRFSTEFYKIASFIGSSNDNAIISDPTGSRRFWPIEITSADYNHKVNMEQLWSQAYKHWIDGEQYWLSRSEQIELSVYNEAFTRVHPYEEYINRFVRPGKEQYTATQISEFINTQLENKGAVNPRHLGIYLKKAGYENQTKLINNHYHRIYQVSLVEKDFGLIVRQDLVVRPDSDSDSESEDPNGRNLN